MSDKPTFNRVLGLADIVSINIVGVIDTMSASPKTRANFSDDSGRGEESGGIMPPLDSLSP